MKHMYVQRHSSVTLHYWTLKSLIIDEQPTQANKISDCEHARPPPSCPVQCKTMGEDLCHMPMNDIIIQG